jgi:hypothetical protein
VDNTEQTESRITIVTVPPAEIEVTHLDGSKETVMVGHIPISKFRKFAFLIAWGDESRVIELYCDKPEGWADTLTLDGLNALAAKGQEINLPFFEIWSQRQAQWKRVFESALAESNSGAKITPSNG